MGNKKIGQCPTCGDCLTMDHQCGPLYNAKKQEKPMEDRLRECPFCKHEASIHMVDVTGCYDRSIKYAYQPGCETEMCPGEWGGASYEREEEARKEWNTRATDPLLEEMAMALEACIKSIECSATYYQNSLWTANYKAIQALKKWEATCNEKK